MTIFTFPSPPRIYFYCPASFSFWPTKSTEQKISVLSYSSSLKNWQLLCLACGVQSGFCFACLSLISVLSLTCPYVFSTCPVDWHKLTTMENTVTTASEVLLGSCVDLFKKGLITTGLELVAGLGPCQECSRYTLEVVLLCMFFSI